MVRPLTAVEPAAPEVSDAYAEARRRRWSGAAAVLCVVVPITMWFLPLGLEAPIQRALAVSSFMTLAWITGALEYALAGLIGCYLFWVLGIAPVQVAFGGFAETTTWFIFGAFLFGRMASKSGLGRRLAYMVMRAVGHSYSRLLLGLILSDFLLTIIVPSGVARVVIMAAVALGLMEAFGVGKTSNIARGMFIILTYTASIFDKMIIAGAASITARGLIEKVGNVEVLWSRWFLAYLPCDLITIFVAWRLTLYFFPPERAELPGGSEYLSNELRRMGRWTVLEKRSAILMLVAVGLWVTDFIHHIPSPMIGLGVGLAAALPRVGVLDADDVRKIDYLPLFFVAAALSMGQVLVATKALDVLTDVVFGWMEPHITNVYSSTLVLYWSAFLYHLPIGDEVAMLATSIPVLMNFAREQNLDPLALGMIWTFGAGAKLFVYQSGVIVVGYSYGCFEARDMLKIGACLTIVESLILLLLVPWYWPLLGV